MASKSNLKVITRSSETDTLGTQAFLAAIVDSSEDAIYGKSLDGIILTWNKGAETIFGYAAAEVVGHSVGIMVPPNRPDEVPEILEENKAGRAGRSL